MHEGDEGPAVQRMQQRLSGLGYWLGTPDGEYGYLTSEGVTKVAVTPKGTYSVIHEVNGLDHGPLGTLYRSKYFVGGYAVHGYTSVPAYPASHGCARVSNQAMDMIWSRNLMPMGRTVVVF